MSKFVRFCRNCNKNSNNESSLRGKGYSIYLPEDKYICEVCGEELIDLSMLSSDYDILTNISNNPNFIESMIRLSQKDSIEYQLKMSQFKTNISDRQENYIPKCPTCGSTNIEKISATKKAFGGAMFGLFSSDVRNSMHCKNCGAKW